MKKTTREAILRDFSTTYWLKSAYEQLSKRDIVDAVGDAETLFKMMKSKYREVSGQDWNFGEGE